jgi:hypothetical protein
MNLVEDKIVHLLTGKHNLFEVSVDELQAISDEQPFFSVAQLLLTQKMKQVNHPGFVQQLQKTALFFPNIFWLDKHLQESQVSNFPSAVTATPAPSYDTKPTYYTPEPEPVKEPEPPAPVWPVTAEAAPATPAPASYYAPHPADEDDMNPITAQYDQAPAPVAEAPARVVKWDDDMEVAEPEPVPESVVPAWKPVKWDDDMPASEPEPVPEQAAPALTVKWDDDMPAAEPAASPWEPVKWDDGMEVTEPTPVPEPAASTWEHPAANDNFETTAVDEPVTEQQTVEPVAAIWEQPAAHMEEEREILPLPEEAPHITPEPEEAFYTAPKPPTPPVEEAQPIQEPVAVAWDYTPATIEEVGVDPVESFEVIAAPVEAPYVLPEPETAATPPVEDAVIEEEAPAEIVHDAQEQSADYEHAIKESFAATVNEEAPAIDEDDLPVDVIGEAGDAGHLPNMRLAEMMQQQADSFNKPLAENEMLAIEGEPYHTIDYFASQGIKALESGSEDGMSKKVRKFTDWLKQMKKVNNLADLGTDAELEQVVHGIAATSIESKEIVTEAMADVLVKQGKIDKAVLLYSKLSFLNPAKTAYFAAKIIELKGN